MENDGWVSLNGCNACINSSICKDLGNCVLLTVDEHFPVNDKRKRKAIQRLRGMPHMTREKIDEIVWDVLDSFKVKVTGQDNRPKDPEEKTYRTWNGPVRLTVIEKMCINSLKRYHEQKEEEERHTHHCGSDTGEC